MKNLLRAVFLSAFALFILYCIYGCHKGVTPSVGNIEGPDAVNENTSAEFRIVTESGTGITYAWSSDNPDLCEFNDPTAGIVEAGFGEVPEDTVVTLRVVVDADQYGPVIKSKEVTILDIPPFYVSDIAGADELEEYCSTTYSVEAFGVTGITYSWTCNPPDAGVFSNPDSATTGFEASEVTADTEIDIRVTVGADDYEPVVKTKVVTIKQTTGLYVEEIMGPDLLEENSVAYYLITADGDTGISYQWSDDPPGLGDFDDPTSSTPEFSCGTVQEDTQIELRVVVYSDHYDPVTKTKSVTIVALSPFAGARTWGGYGIDSCEGIATDLSGNVYVTGDFNYYVDFDFGPGHEECYSMGGSDIFLGKYNSYGDLQWVRTWGGHYSDGGRSVAVDHNFNVYVTGYFRYTADFHPGYGTETHTSFGYDDIFLSKFDSDGEFQWAHTWGGPRNDHGLGVAEGDGKVYVTGFFNDTVDFDPGMDDVDEHSANGLFQDAFLSVFHDDGKYSYAKTWGGIYNDVGNAVRVRPNGSPCVVGYYSGDVDFDIGSNVDMHVSNGSTDAYLMFMFQNGSIATTWGGEGMDSAEGLAISPDGGIRVSGYFSEVVDFDPGSGTAFRTASNHYSDAYVSAFIEYGEYMWVETWGGDINDEGSSVVFDEDGNTYVTGYFRDEMQLYVGTSLESFTTNGLEDIYLHMIDPQGSTKAFYAWGGESTDLGKSIAVDNYGNIWVSGLFSDKVDFDPTAGVTVCYSYSMYDAFLVKFLYEGFK